MILLDTDTYTLHQFAHERVLERSRTASEAPSITIVTQIEVLRGRHEAFIKAEDGGRILHAQRVLALTLDNRPPKWSSGLIGPSLLCRSGWKAWPTNGSLHNSLPAR